MNIRDRVQRLDRVPANRLTPHPENWRVHNDAQRQALQAVLQQIGFAGAVLAVERNGGYLTVDGHLRSEQMGAQEVPVLVLDLTDDEVKQVLLTFDPIGGMATANKERLETLLAGYDASKASGTAAALADGLQANLDKMLRRVARDAGSDWGKSTGQVIEDKSGVLSENPVTETGDLWTIGGHRIICGDATDEATIAYLMNGERADCVFTSPPYAVGIDYGMYEDTIANLRALLTALPPLWNQVVIDGGFAVLNFNDVATGNNIAEVQNGESPHEYPMAIEYYPRFTAGGWVLWSRRVWCKPNARVNSLWCIGSNRAATDWEHIWTFKRPGTAIVQRVDGQNSSAIGWIDTTHQEGVEVGKEIHGAGMAVSIAARMVAIHSRKGQIVHEPFLGTGTTASACHQTGRRCYASELNPAYCDLSLERISLLSGEEAILGSTGELFQVVKERREAEREQA